MKSPITSKSSIFYPFYNTMNWTKKLRDSLTIQWLFPLIVLFFKTFLDIELEVELFDGLLEATLALRWIIQVIIWRVRAQQRISGK